MDFDALEFGSRFELIIKEKGLSRIAFAEKIGSNRQTIANLIQGKGLPRADFFGKMKVAYPDISLDMLFLPSENQTCQAEPDARSIAVSDKIKELETQLAACRQEKEELKTENRQLLRDAGKTDGQLEMAQARIAEMKAELKDRNVEIETVKTENEAVLLKIGELTRQSETFRNQRDTVVAHLRNHEDVTSLIANWA